MISFRLASLRLSVCGKNCHVAMFADAKNIISVKLCMMVVLIELYPSIPLSVTWIVFQGHSSVRQFELIEIKLFTIVDYVM